MLDRRSFLALSVPGLVLVAAFVAAFVATAADAVMLIRAGGWYALAGNFLAVAGMMVLFLVGGFLAVAAFVLLPFILLARGTSPTALAVAEWFEKRGLVSSRMGAAWLGNAPGSEPNRTWEPVFGDFMEQGSGWRKNVATVIQLGAYPIAGILLLLGLRLYQWLIPRSSDKDP